MKRIISFITAILMMVGIVSITAGCEEKNRENVLKLYVPGEYIDETIFESFSEWYEEKTGNTVTVEVKPFDAVEDIQLAVEGSKADYDLLCPSDYMVEYLISKNLLLEVDKSIIDISKDNLMKSQYLDTTKEFDPSLKYAVPYMYGTLGIAYDITKTGKKITSWTSLYGDEFAGQGTRSIKDSVRDAYVSACIYSARDSLIGLTGAAQKSAIQAIFEDTSEATIEKAKNVLNSVKESGAVWDVDDVKFGMAAGTNKVKVALMWSCDAGYVMNDYEDANGVEQEGNRNIWYVVPEEGGNVYMDCFCINKYAKNVTAANYFLAYLCTKEIAMINSEYAGAISPVSEAYDELYDYYMEDEDGIFESVEEDWKEMFIETMFPSAETLNRCGVMKNLPTEGKNALTRMWANI